MIATRPDWCISRQRAWGVPIVALLLRGAAARAARDAGALRARRRRSSSARARTPGSRARSPSWCRPGTRCAEVRRHDASAARPTSSTSGSTRASSWTARRRAAAGAGRPRRPVPRGQRPAPRLVPQLAADRASRSTGRAPYDAVLTHGFIARRRRAQDVEVARQRASRPTSVIKQHGAEILRLWVAAEDYRDDIRISEEILGQLVEAYRRIRNTARFLLGNLYDFDPGARRACRTRRCRSSSAGRCTARTRSPTRVPRGLRGVRVPRRLPRAQQLLQRRPERALPRRAQGPPLLRARRRAGAPRDADGAARASSTRSCGSWRRSCRSPPRRSGSYHAGARPSRERVPRRASASRRRRGATTRWRRASSACSRCAPRSPRRSRRRGRPGVVKQSREARVVARRATATLGDAARARERPSCRRCSSSREVALDGAGGAESPLLPGLRVRVERAPGRRSASAAGSCARSASIARHPTLCARCAAVRRVS